MNSEQRISLIESYGQAHAKVLAAIADIPPAAFTWRPGPGPGKWSIHENLVHLADSEANSFIRLRRILAEPGSGVYGYDQDAWARELNYHEQSWKECLELFSLLRSLSYKLLKNLKDADWNKTIDHSENGIMTLEDWLKSYEAHTHVSQIRRTFEAWKSQSQNSNS